MKKRLEMNQCAGCHYYDGDGHAKGCQIEALMERIAALESEVAELQPHSKQSMRPFSNRPGD